MDLEDASLGPFQGRRENQKVYKACVSRNDSIIFIMNAIILWDSKLFSSIVPM
jgi:hypothetical protein